MKISIVGLGWFGSSLAEALAGHDISGTHRTDLNQSNTPSAAIMEADVLVLNIPPFKDQLKWFQSWNWSQKTHVIFISSTSVYGQETGELDESILPIPSTENGELLLQEEEWIRTFTHHTVIRFGGLLGKNRHPGKVLSGRKNLSGGNRPVNLLHLDDAVGFTKLVIENKLKNRTFNLVNPEHPTREAFYRSYCESQKLPLPEFEIAPLPGKSICSSLVESLYEFKVKLL